MLKGLLTANPQLGGLLGGTQEPTRPKKRAPAPTEKLQQRLDALVASPYVKETLFRLAGGPVEMRAGDFRHAPAETSQTENTMSLGSYLAGESSAELRRIVTGEIGQTFYKRRADLPENLRNAIDGIAADPRARRRFEEIEGMGLEPGAEAVREAVSYALQQIHGLAEGEPPVGGMKLARIFREMLEED